jgi:ketosteroid isomerase-like protein
MSEENVELLRAAFRAFENGDIGGVLSLCDEDIEIIQPVELPDAAPRQRGHEGVLEAFAIWPEQWDDFHIEVLRVADFGDCVMVTMLNRGRGKESAVEVEGTFTHLFTVRAGKIAAWRMFMLEEDALQAVREAD